MYSVEMWSMYQSKNCIKTIFFKLQVHFCLLISFVTLKFKSNVKIKNT